MDFFFVLIGLSTTWLFMFKIEWLFQTRPFMINLVCNVILFAVSFSLIQNEIGNPKLVVALRMPLLSSLVFLVLYKIFFKMYGRNPENTFWVFTKKPIQDVIFTISYWFLGGGLPFVLI